MTVPPVLLSVNVGLPKNVAWQGKTVYTGAWKHPVDGPATTSCWTRGPHDLGETIKAGEACGDVESVKSVKTWPRRS